MEKEHTQIDAEVCIVGAGPGGALLAYLLGKANIKTILLERNSDLNKEFRGEHLNEQGEEILKTLGLYEKLESIGLLAMEKVEYWQHNKLLKTILPSKKENGHTGIHVPQKHLLQLLLEESSRFPSFELWMNSRVIDLIKDDNHYTGLKVLIDGEEKVITCKIIVGADGRFSTVRKKAGFPVRSISHGYDLLWAKIPAPNGWEPTIKMALANNSQLALFTQYADYIQIGWNIEENSYPSLRKQSFQSFIQHLLEHFPILEASVNETIRSWDDFVLLKVQSSASDTWVINNVVIMGDAAHTMSPTGAFGLNSSMKDAEVLASTIVEILSKGQDLQMLKQFELKRRAEIEAIQAEQQKREKSFQDNFIH